jgi:hypothetical protein
MMSIAGIHGPYPRVAELRLVELPLHFGDGDGGRLTVVEGENHVPFAIERVFTLRAPIGAVRGAHAHRRCNQLMMCAYGAIEVVCDDATERRSFLLDRTNLGLLVPPNVWASEIFRHSNSVLLVICDRLYDADDYIRDYTEFRLWRRANSTRAAEKVAP